MCRAAPGSSLHSCAGSRKGRLPVIGRIDIKLPHWLPEKPVRGTPLATPLINIVEREF